MRKRLTASMPLFILVALTLIFFYKLAFTNLILARGDTYAYFYPYWGARDAALMQGKLPLWTPDIFMGAPLLANPQLGTFYPPNWLTLPLNPPDSVRISLLLHVAWASIGTYALAKTVLQGSTSPPGPLSISWRGGESDDSDSKASSLFLASGFRGEIPALIAGVLFGLGGYVGAHVEQINQLQGLSWMPWAFLLFQRALRRPTRYLPLLALALALQIFTGHTQTVFITLVGLGVYGLVWAFESAGAVRELSLQSLFRSLLILGIAGVITLILAVPQIIPTLELIGLSNRGGGLNQNEATAFSLSPLILGRGLLPSYDGQLFGEFVAYVGVIGLGLALVGIFARRRDGKGLKPTNTGRTIWIVIALLGLLLALGRFNPVYWALASLPGFNYFRVPARWLSLFALSMSLLAGIGTHYLLNGVHPGRRLLALIVAITVALAGASMLAGRTAEDIVGPAAPTLTTVIGWLVALTALLILFTGHHRVLSRDGCKLSPAYRYAILGTVLFELFLAAQIMPYNDLAPPEAYNAPRFTISQMQVYGDDQTPPGRMLSISGLFFDPGDKAALERRYRRLGMDDLAIRHALVATKKQETIFPNLSLAWGVPAVDGFGGGLLPTLYYTQFISLMLPPDTLRTVDGRLGEMLAREDCRGACIPAEKWLNLTNTQYVITDKVFDVWHEGVAYDTQLPRATEEPVIWSVEPIFQADAVDMLYLGERPPDSVRINRAGNGDEAISATLTIEESAALGELEWVRYGFDRPVNVSRLTVSVSALSATTVYAVTLVDRRTGDFAQLTPSGWPRVLSSDIKIYQREIVSPRATVVHDVVWQPDDWDGSEAALAVLLEEDFDPQNTVILHGVPAPVPENNARNSTARIVDYQAERVEIEVEADGEGYLVLKDAYYPGWTATVSGKPTAVYRANVMFQAVQVPAGESTVVFEYQPAWLPGVLIVGALAWLAIIVAAWYWR